MLKTIIAAAVAVSSLTFVASPSFAEGTGEACGFWAFAGAFADYDKAADRQRQVGGEIWNISGSDSPNAHLDLFVVTEGPGSRSEANRWKRQFRDNGVYDAYVARRCLVSG